MRKRHYSSLTSKMKSQFVCILICLLCFAPVVNAQWELVKGIYSSNAFLITQKGSMLMSDMIFDGKGEGSIWRSEDNGATWTKCDVPKNNYGIFYEAGNYIFAGASGCRIARSSDDGKTWEILRYDNVVEDLSEKPGEAEQKGNAISILYFKNKLYFADFGNGVVLYSENFGEKWDLTDTKSLYVEAVGASDNLYQLQEYKGELYAFGALSVFKMDEKDLTWETIRNSNFTLTAIEYNGKLIAAHGGQNMGEPGNKIENIIYTENGKDWSDFPCPKEIWDNAIRVLATDGIGVFAGSQNCGIYYTADEGKNWKKLDYSDKMAFFVPMKFDFTEKEAYVSSWDVTEKSGLYKMSKSELTGVQALRNDQNFKIYTQDNHFLHIAAQDNSNFAVSIIDTYGKTVYNGKNQNNIDITSLIPGIYICQVIANGITYTNKLIKK